MKLQAQFFLQNKESEFNFKHRDESNFIHGTKFPTQEKRDRIISKYKNVIYGEVEVNSLDYIFSIEPPRNLWKEHAIDHKVVVQRVVIKAE